MAELTSWKADLLSLEACGQCLLTGRYNVTMGWELAFVGKDPQKHIVHFLERGAAPVLLPFFGLGINARMHVNCMSKDRDRGRTGMKSKLLFRFLSFLASMEKANHPFHPSSLFCPPHLVIPTWSLSGAHLINHSFCCKPLLSLLLAMTVAIKMLPNVLNSLVLTFLLFISFKNSLSV